MGKKNGKSILMLNKWESYGIAGHSHNLGTKPFYPLSERTLLSIGAELKWALRVGS